MNTDKRTYTIPTTCIQLCNTVQLICVSGPQQVGGDVVSGGTTGSNPGGGL